MAEKYSKLHLSESVNGRPIKISQTGSPGNLLHTVIADMEEIWLTAYNASGSDSILTIEFGGTTSTDDLLRKQIPGYSGILVVAGIPLSGGLSVRAYADGANIINIVGFC